MQDATKKYRIDGLLAATFCPFKEDGQVNYDLIPKYVDYLHKNGVIGVFVNGTCGEGVSMSTEERKLMAEAWIKHGKGKLQEFIIHCGSTSLPESKALASHAAEIGATGVACVAPFYYKAIRVEGIADFLAQVAASCPKLPFYYYHFPDITTFKFSAKSVFDLAGPRIPNLAGLKFTGSDIKDACAIANMPGGYQCLVGFDDLYLSWIANGLGTGAVGAFHNFMPRVTIRIREAYERGDMAEARKEQERIHKICQIAAKYSAVLREFMYVVGLDLGPARLPLIEMTAEKKRQMKNEMEEMGFFEWIK